jgi:Tfp pilus assembly protein PilF
MAMGHTGDARALTNDAAALQKRGRWEDALASYDEAIAIDPGLLDALFNRAIVLEELGRLDAALASYEEIIAIDAGHPAVHFNRGLLLTKLARWDEGLLSYDRALALNPDYAEAHCNRGNVLRRLGRDEAALASYDRALAVRGDHADAHYNRGVVLQELRQFDAALASYDAAIASRPDHALAHFNRSTALLAMGDFERGWPDYEWRWMRPSGPTVEARRHFRAPLWRGEKSPAGKSLLIYGEQGLGDTIQFCRYVPLLEKLGARVILEAPWSLVRLLGPLPGLSRVIARGDPLPEIDAQCPLASLPLAFNTTLASVPVARRYLSADPAEVACWQARLGRKTKPRIGLAWSGNPEHANDRARSIALADWLPRLPCGFEYVSLQKEQREADARTLRAQCAILDPADDLTDFGATAALCECLDLVISVDTSVAHLGSALGRPTWILLPFNADWRWLIGRDDSPWYPSAMLFRQERPGDWSGVLGRVSAQLIETFAGDAGSPHAT